MTRIMIWLAAGIFSLALPAPALAQTQITTAVIEGVVVDASGARAARRRRRSPQRRHQLHAHARRPIATGASWRCSCRPAATP